jgi:excisionase family DNA binding protein
MSPAVRSTKPLLQSNVSSSNGIETRRAASSAKFYTIAQIAELLEVSTRTVRRWIARGALAVHRIGNLVRISEADLRSFLARSRESE